MPLETGSYISDLVVTNPAATDTLAQADDHIRLVKAILKTTFPNFTGALTASQAQLDATYGSIQSFPKTRADILSGGGVGSIATGINFLECDGATYAHSNFPALGAYLGSTYGGNGTTTFAVPNLKDTGRFLRSRTASVAVGTYQANAFKAHTHTLVSGTVGGTTDQTGTNHTHTQQGTFRSGGVTVQHTHPAPALSGINGPAGAPGNVQGAANSSTGADGPDHQHDVTISGQTGGMSLNHTHSYTGTVNALSLSSPGDPTETRPESFVTIMCIKV